MGNLRIALIGLTMGIAEVIPGVSGGTIAFISGIYEKLIQTISSIDKEFFSLLFKFRLNEIWEKINGKFLFFLLIGMFAGIASGALGISYLLEHYSEILWGFFFGLILCSAIFMLRDIDQKTWKEYGLVVLGFLFAYFITNITPSTGSASLVFVFVSGMIAISAMILPGISGSFILLLMGMYSVIIPELRNLLTDFNIDSLLIITVFGFGCLTGLALFSRLLTYTFAHFKKQTVSVLAGFMFGSLFKIWPWRNPLSWYNKNTKDIEHITERGVAFYRDAEHLKIMTEQNVLPGEYVNDPMTLGVILAFLLGARLIVVAMKKDVV